MADKTKIQWTEATWNPLRTQDGWHCEKISPGCASCYAEGFNNRFGTKLPYTKASRAKVTIQLNEKDLPLHWRKPRKVFVCSMTDLFAEFVTDEMIDRVFAVMALTPQHTYQVLTKRAERMQEYCSHEFLHQRIHEAIKHRMGYDNPKRPAINRGDLPLPNVWLGTSVENQEYADKRIPHLLATPAAVRFLSVEPLLGRIGLLKFLWNDHAHVPLPDGVSMTHCSPIDWVIVGGESGHGARACDVSWVRSIVQQCKSADVPCFVKQLGSRPIAPLGGCTLIDCQCGLHHGFRDSKAGDPAEWPEDLRVRQYPLEGAASSCDPPKPDDTPARQDVEAKMKELIPGIVVHHLPDEGQRHQDAAEDYDLWCSLNPCQACDGVGEDDDPPFTCTYCNGTGIDPDAEYDGAPPI